MSYPSPMNPVQLTQTIGYCLGIILMACAIYLAGWGIITRKWKRRE